MGLIAMSERDLQRIEILSKVMADRMTLVSASHVLDLSTRQVRRLLERMRTGGAASIRHKAIDRPSNNRISDGVRDYAVTLVRERYADFGPTLAAEKFAERDGLRVSRETLRSWMVDAGPWLSRKQRRTVHQPRLRREAYGEQVQTVQLGCHIMQARVGSRMKCDMPMMPTGYQSRGRRNEAHLLPDWIGRTPQDCSLENGCLSAAVTAIRDTHFN
jgi:hypothetical protein